VTGPGSAVIKLEFTDDITASFRLAEAQEQKQRFVLFWARCYRVRLMVRGGAFMTRGSLDPVVRAIRYLSETV